MSLSNSFDLVIIGAGAAGLTSAIFAGEAAQGTGLRIALIDGAKKPGAKILVSGGGRCNVTNREVTPEDFWGGSRTTIRNVLRAFDNQRTLQWMTSLGVELKLEPTGKYFPVTDKAKTVLDALMTRVRSLGVAELYGARVLSLDPTDKGFSITTEKDVYTARRIIIATGGKSLPKSGSDGWGLEQVEALGHHIVETTPALVPLVLNQNTTAGGRFQDLSGLTMDLRLGLYRQSGKVIEERTSSLLFTHFGLSGPAALDFSRHWLREKETVTACIGHPDFSRWEEADKWLQEQVLKSPKRSVDTVLQALYPERMARLLGEGAGKMAELSKAKRRQLAEAMVRLPISIQGARGWSFAETTAGGVDLKEIDPRTMRSRVVSNLFLCGEMLDVDGRIGGFNFQWAWASGYLAGRGAVAELLAN